jgi:DNA polymerase-1
LLHVSEDRAAEIREQILGKFVALAKKLREWEAFTRQNGYSRTYLWDEEKNLWVPGRLRYLYDVGHEFGGLASKAKNASVNSPIQGTAGDLTLLALIKINKWIEDNNIDASLVLTVHDSIVLTSSFKDAIKTAVNAKRIMEEISPNGVPLVADCEIGLNYGKAIDLKDIIAGAASIANNLPIDDVEKVSGLLQNEPEFGILINLAPYVGDYSEAA